MSKLILFEQILPKYELVYIFEKFTKKNLKSYISYIKNINDDNTKYEQFVKEHKDCLRSFIEGKSFILKNTKFKFREIKNNDVNYKTYLYIHDKFYSENFEIKNEKETQLRIIKIEDSKIPLTPSVFNER